MWENHQCESQAGQSRSLRIKPNPKPKKCLWILPFHSKVPSYPACPMVWAGSCWNTFIFLFMGQIHWIIILYNNAAASPLFRWKLQWMLVALLWLWIRLLCFYTKSSLLCMFLDGRIHQDNCIGFVYVCGGGETLGPCDIGAITWAPYMQSKCFSLWNHFWAPFFIILNTSSLHIIESSSKFVNETFTYIIAVWWALPGSAQGLIPTQS